MSPMAFIPNVGIPELIIILVIVLLLFGHRLPGIGKSLGKSVSEFKQGFKGEKDDLKGKPSDDQGSGSKEEQTK